AGGSSRGGAAYRHGSTQLWRVCGGRTRGLLGGGAGPARAGDRRPQAAGLLGGEREGEAGATADLLRDRQAEAAAFRVAPAGLVGAEGPLADLRQVGRGYPGAVVDDGEGEPVVAGLFEQDRHVPAG